MTEMLEERRRCVVRQVMESVQGFHNWVTGGGKNRFDWGETNIFLKNMPCWRWGFWGFCTRKKMKHYSVSTINPHWTLLQQWGSWWVNEKFHHKEHWSFSVNTVQTVWHQYKKGCRTVQTDGAILLTLFCPSYHHYIVGPLVCISACIIHALQRMMVCTLAQDLIANRNTGSPRKREKRNSKVQSNVEPEIVQRENKLHIYRGCSDLWGWKIENLLTTVAERTRRTARPENTCKWRLYRKYLRCKRTAHNQAGKTCR